MKKHPHIFIVDDNRVVTEMLKFHFTEHNDWKVTVFNDGFEMLKHLNQEPDIVVLDYHLNDTKRGLDGNFYLKRTKRFATIVLSGQRNIETAVNLLKQGAFDYIVKDENVLFKLEKSIQKILQTKEKVKDIHHHKGQIQKDMLGLFAFLVLLCSFIYLTF